jgi:hypothetical protein
MKTARTRYHLAAALALAAATTFAADAPKMKMTPGDLTCDICAGNTAL